MQCNDECTRNKFFVTYLCFERFIVAMVGDIHMGMTLHIMHCIVIAAGCTARSANAKFLARRLCLDHADVCMLHVDYDAKCQSAKYERTLKKFL